MRHLIDIVEAAFPGGETFWFNPATKQVLRCADHGTAVADDPGEFGIEWGVETQMDQAFGDDDEDEEGGTVPTDSVAGLWGGVGGWGRNDAWEQLAMNNGWVRVGVGRNGSYATYLSSSTGQAVWHAARYLVQQDSLTDRMEIEVSREHNSLMIYLGAESIEQFLRTRAPEAFLTKMDRQHRQFVAGLLPRSGV